MTAASLQTVRRRGRMRLPVRDESYQQTALGQHVPGWLTELEYMQRAPKTVDKYERFLAQVCLSRPELGPDGWDENLLMDALMMFPPGSRRYVSAALKGFFDWAWRSRLTAENPMLRVRRIPPKKQRLVRVFSEADESQLCSLPDIRDRALMQLLFGTGIRLGEATALQRKHVNETDRKLSVHNSKNDKSRVVPMPRWVTTAMVDLIMLEGLNDRDYLWYVTRGGQYRTVYRDKRVAQTSFYLWWKRCLVAAGVVPEPEPSAPFGSAAYRAEWDRAVTSHPNYKNPHTTRHTYVTRSLQAGARMERLSRILGHESVAVTDKYYSHLVTGDLMEDVDMVAEARGL